MQDVKGGEQDKGVIQWLCDSGPFLCPSCCLSTHHDEAATSELANNMYWEYNVCLASKHKKLCCFLCSELVPLSNGSHAAGCIAKHHASPLQAASRTYHQLTMVHSQSSQLYKAATHYACPLLSCIDCNWHQDKANAWMVGNSVIAPDCRQQLELGGSKIVIISLSTSSTNTLFRTRLAQEGYRSQYKYCHCENVTLCCLLSKASMNKQVAMAVNRLHTYIVNLMLAVHQAHDSNTKIANAQLGLSGLLQSHNTSNSTTGWSNQ